MSGAPAFADADGRGDVAALIAVGRAEALDVAECSFDACRFERVLQHVAAPAAALREAARVLRPGGQVAVLEPDWSRLQLTGADPEVTGRVVDIRRRTRPAPDVGARVSRLLRTAGFTEVRALELRLSGCQAEARRGLRLDTYAAEAVRLGAISETAATQWLVALDRAATEGELDVRFSLHLAAGTRR